MEKRRTYNAVSFFVVDTKKRNFVGNLKIKSMETLVANNQNVNFEDIKELFRESDKKFEKMFQETDKKFQETDRLFKEMREESKESWRKLNKVGKLVGNMGRNNGTYAEEYFYRRLKNHRELLNIKFKEIDRYVKRETGTLDGQYDLVLHNCDYLFVVEVKSKLIPTDIVKFKEKSLPKFKLLFPHYADKKLYIVMAGLVVVEDCKPLCEDYGFLLLTQTGKDIAILSPSDFQPQTY